MNRHLLIIPIVIALMVMATICQHTMKKGKTTNDAKPLRLVISAPPSVSIKAPLGLIGYLQNTTKQPVSFENTIFRGYNVYTIVTDEKNRKIDYPGSNLAIVMISEDPTKTITTLAPQEKLILRKTTIGLIALTTPGKYSVQVKVFLDLELFLNHDKKLKHQKLVFLQAK